MSAPGKAAPLAVGALVLALLPAGASAQARQLEIGVESFAYRSATTPLNRDNVLGLDAYPGLGRLGVGWRETHGAFRAVFRGYVERAWGTQGDETDWVVRQGYAQYWWGEKVGLRLGKQRIAWGSGFAWNPTNRLEPPKNVLNTTLEQEGALAARLDWAPAAWASLVLVGATTDATPRDLPVAAGDALRRDSLALRARFLVKDTDLAVVASGGKNQRTLFGLDVGRDLGWAAVHAEAALYEGAEMFPPRDDTLFFRVVAGALRTSGENAFALEYFYNGEGYSDAGTSRWLDALDRSWTAAQNPVLPPELQQQALATYAAGASIPYAGGLGLRRHYLHASWSRGGATSVWTGAVRTVVGLSDGALALTPGVGWAPRGNVTLNVDAIVLLGPEESEYRLAPVRGTLQARLKVLF
ncbi:MAG TPA: hypothetical protein VE359_10030 [Vicinamibacteria bacterium]|nr:hypothetical protein [Vicinamibacteria bacterium]